LVRNIARRRFEVSLSGLLLILAASAAHAGSIQQSCTITDVGWGDPTFSTAVGGSQTGYFADGANGIVIAPNGQTAYPFPVTCTGTEIPTPTSFPLLDPAPVSGNGPGFSFASSPVLYPNGIAITNDQVGVNAPAGGSSSWQRYDVYYVQRNPDGSWGQPVGLVQGTMNLGMATVGPNVGAMLSKSGEILEYTRRMGTISDPHRASGLVAGTAPGSDFPGARGVGRRPAT